MYDVRCTTSEEEEEEEEEDLDCPVPEHVGLCQEGVAGDIGEGVALAHLLWGDERRKLFQENFQGFSFTVSVPETPCLGPHGQLSLGGC